MTGSGRGGDDVCAIYYEKRKVNLSTVFAGQKVGVPHVSQHVRPVSFFGYVLGYFDDEACGWIRLRPVSAESVTHVSG